MLRVWVITTWNAHYTDTSPERPGKQLQTLQAKGVTSFMHPAPKKPIRSIVILCFSKRVVKKKIPGFLMSKKQPKGNS